MVAHDTPLRLLSLVPEGSGTPVSDHPAPFHVSTRRCTTVLRKKVPTATQCDALGHETPVRLAPVAPAGFGLATIPQSVPFHRSTSVPRPRPTAKQFEELEHVTLESWLSDAPAGFGFATTDQLAPSHCSINELVTSRVS